MVSGLPADFCDFMTHILVMWKPLFSSQRNFRTEGREILMAGKRGNRPVSPPRHFPRTGPLSERPWTCSDCTSRFPRPGVASLPRCRTSFSQVFTRLRQAPHFSVPANVPRSKTSARLWIRRQCGSRACLELTPHIFRRSRVFLLPPSPLFSP